ncbi:ABC transporter ATP-binding protein [Riemerella columbipharyngis]|uniref:Macrolide transport system ATP-binding/permease protein n=1 Tax=Riemerella columbipharyngis TaxID=1071918 RepID=A0A1G7AR93_9FLAO|nr:ATP-binding cassette domain-containing protein [Riemerella columbipharyngis]SDE17311.1 macrolide transport system ATP-binding/permease protein [Riemerella columbipharyngis]
MKIELKQFSYKRQLILQNIRLEMGGQDKISISGENGSGKSTLLNLICGKLKSDIEIEGLPSMGYYGKEAHLNSEWTLADHRVLFDQELNLSRFHTLIEVLNFENFRNVKIKKLSQGNKVKAHLIFVLSLDRMLYILDEPTENLDKASIAGLANFIEKSDYQFIIVSHDKFF